MWWNILFWFSSKIFLFYEVCNNCNKKKLAYYGLYKMNDTIQGLWRCKNCNAQYSVKPPSKKS